MLFSDPELAGWINEHFECAWRSLGPPARVHIDLPNGETLDRTLGGNILTWVTTPNGAVLDVLPGVMDRETYKRLLAACLEKGETVPPTRVVKLEMGRPSLRPPITRAMQASSSWGVALQAELAKVPTEGLDSNNPLAKLERVPAFRISTPLPRIGTFEVSLNKATGEMPMIDLFDRSGPSSRLVDMDLDSRMAEGTLHPQALAIASAFPACPPEELAPEIYRMVLHFDVNDPFLGLGAGLEGALSE
ncbi:MAG: hypothetical protein R3F33_17020 [Planctomycetota bacterium]